jgi:mraZ protein
VGESGVAAMFMGQYGHNIDSKGRTIIPSKYREGLGDTFVITRGLDGCLFLYPMPEWEKFVDKLQQLPSSQKTRKIQRQFLSKAMEVSLDKQGRILVPKMLRASAGLEKEVVFAGMMNRVEVWDKERFAAEELEEEEVSLDSIMDELGIPL